MQKVYDDGKWPAPARSDDLAERSIQISRILQLVPGLRSEYAGNHNEGHDAQRVAVDPVADEVPVQHDSGHDRCQPQQQPERTQVNRA